MQGRRGIGEALAGILRNRLYLVEWLLIATLVFSYSAGILDLGSDRPLPGTEAEVFQSLDQILVQSLSESGSFPLWNPYIGTGQPYVADPFLHVYNPLATIPVLLFGVMDGFKIALFLSFLTAAFGMWWLATVMGMGFPSRLWVALMYAFTGQIAARFLQGQYDFVLGFAWIPWVFGGLISTVERREKRYPALTAIFLALLFFSGNVYYAYYMFFAIAIFAVVLLMNIGSRPIALTVDRDRTKMLLLAGGLALGLIGVQLLPLVQAWPYMSKESNPDLRDSHTFVQIVQDYLSKDLPREDASQILPPEEFYAYMGPGPFIALLLLPLGLRRKQKRELLFFGLLLAVVLLWIDVKRMPWAELYSRTSFLIQFRYPTRMLIYGAAAILVLAGAGMDSLWGWARGVLESRIHESTNRSSWILGRLGMGLISTFMIWSILDVYSTNKERVVTWNPYQPPEQIMGWLAEYDSGEYYVSNLLNWPRATIANGIRYIDAWYGYAFHSPKEHMLNQRPVMAQPKYLVLGNEKLPEDPNARLVRRFESHTIYELPESLPFAWSAPEQTLREPSNDQELRAGEVTPLTPVVTGPNSLQISAHGDGESTLVVMSAYYPGWTVRIDGRPVALRNVGGYLAADLPPGEHEVVFAYRPMPFLLGLIISLASLGLAAGLIVRGSETKLVSLARRLRRSGAFAFPPSRPKQATSIPMNRPHAGESEAAVPASSQRGRLNLGESFQLEAESQLQIHASLDRHTQLRISIQVERRE